MTLRKLFVLGTAVVALGVAAGTALAQTPAQKALIDSAKSQGVVGEQADGYLGFRTSTSDPAIQSAVASTNSARRELYVTAAAEVRTTPEVAGARMFERRQLSPQTSVPAGQWYRDAAGQWVQR